MQPGKGEGACPLLAIREHSSNPFAARCTVGYLEYDQGSPPDDYQIKIAFSQNPMKTDA
jgi:hypothetical protein